MRVDSEVAIVLDPGDTLVSLTLTRLSDLMAGSNFNLFCYYQLQHQPALRKIQWIFSKGISLTSMASYIVKLLRFHHQVGNTPTFSTPSDVLRSQENSTCCLGEYEGQNFWLLKAWRGEGELSSSDAAFITFLRLSAITQRNSCIQFSCHKRKVWYSLKNMNVPIGMRLGNVSIWVLWASYNIFKSKIMFA